PAPAVAMCDRPYPQRDCRRAVLLPLQCLSEREGVPRRGADFCLPGRPRRRACAGQGPDADPAALPAGEPGHGAAGLWLVSDAPALGPFGLGVACPPERTGVGGNDPPLAA